MSDHRQEGLAAVIEAAREGQSPFTPDTTEGPVFVAIPEGSKLEEVPTDRYRDAPYRASTTYRPQTVESFLDLVARFADPNVATVWVDLNSAFVTAIFDDNAADMNGWREHRAELRLEATPQWKHWLEKDGQLMTQGEFADHVEVGLEDIVEPAAADLLELAQSFHAKTNSNFRQAIRLQSGETQFQYDEEIEAKAGRTGQLEIPQGIVLGISPFVGEDPYRLFARFRYRLQSGRLSLGYKIDRPDIVRRESLLDIKERIVGVFPSTFVGQPGY